jgi:hypothetical protein
MGLFSFLFGGKKAATKPTNVVVAQKPATASPVIVSVESAGPPAGAVQAKLRLKLAASLRSGERAAAYEAAKGLAEIQTKAGRNTAARVWREQAEKIKAGLAA